MHSLTSCYEQSILPVISKVYDFSNRLQNYFSVKILLSSSQFGFRSGASTEHVLSKFSDDILKLFDQKEVAIATFMDLSKSFDSLDHNILLFNLKRYGINETALQWINMGVGAGVFALIGRIPHSLSLALLTFFLIIIIVTYQTVNIWSPGTRLTHLYLT